MANSTNPADGLILHLDRWCIGDGTDIKDNGYYDLDTLVNLGTNLFVQIGDDLKFGSGCLDVSNVSNSCLLFESGSGAATYSNSNGDWECWFKFPENPVEDKAYMICAAVDTNVSTAFHRFYYSYSGGYYRFYTSGSR